MNIKILILVVLVSALVSCASTPELFLSEDPIEINNVDTLEQFWVLENKSYRFNIQPSRLPEKGVNGYVKIKFLIDSNGNIFDPKIIESVPEGAFDYSALKALSKQKYRKSASNANGRPVYVTQEIKFN